MSNITKTKVTLTIDANVWARCRELKEHGGVNWSEVAEQAFSKIVDIVDRAMVIKAATGSMAEVAADMERNAKSDYDQSILAVQDLQGVTKTPVVK